MDVRRAMEEWKVAMRRALEDLARQIGVFGGVPEKHAGLDELHRELAELQKTTQENLKILIRTVHALPRLPKQ